MELSADLFMELSEGARFEQVGGGDRRQVPRFLITIDAAVVRLNAGAKGRPLAAVVRDLSARGAGFEISESFKVGENFALRFLRRDGSPLWVQCEAARWSPISADRFSVGGKFVKMLGGLKTAESESVAKVS